MSLCCYSSSCVSAYIHTHKHMHIHQKLYTNICRSSQPTHTHTQTKHTVFMMFCDLLTEHLFDFSTVQQAFDWVKDKKTSDKRERKKILRLKCWCNMSTAPKWVPGRSFVCLILTSVAHKHWPRISSPVAQTHFVGSVGRLWADLGSDAVVRHH